MKKLFAFLMLIFLSVPANSYQGAVNNLFDATTVAGTGTTVVSRAINISSSDRMGLWLKLQPNASNASFNGSNVSLQMQASYDDTSANFATISTVSYATNNAATNVTVTCPTAKFVRFRVTGLAGQATDSTVTAYMFTQG